MDQQSKYGLAIAALKNLPQWAILEEMEWEIQKEWGQRLLSISPSDPAHDNIVKDIKGKMIGLEELRRKREFFITVAKKEIANERRNTKEGTVI